MNIFLPLDGTAEVISPEPIYQGSNAVTDITVFSPMPRTTSIELYFILPDEEETKLGPYPMSLIISKVGEYNAWKYRIDRSVTKYVGTVKMVLNAFTLVEGNSGTWKENATSYSCAFEITEGTLPKLPENQPTIDQWDLISQYTEAALAAAGNATEAVNPIAFTTKATSISSDDEAYVNLILSYNGTEIKKWSSATGEWTQISPNPDAETANPTLWTYELDFGLPRSTTPGPKGASVAAGAQNIGMLSSDTEWTAANGGYIYTIPPARHALGDTPNIGVFVTVQDGENNNSVVPDYSVADDGTVTIKATAPFTGTALLVAGAVMNGAVTTETLGVSNPQTEMLNPSVPKQYQQEANRQTVTAVKDLQEEVTTAQETADTAKTAAENAQSTADGKVSKDGDTMTGELVAPTLKGANGVYDGTVRVYSENNPPPSGAVTPDGTYPSMTVGNATNAETAIHANSAESADVSVTAGQANIAMQLGTETKGNSNEPIYLQAGVPQPCTRTIPLVTLNGGQNTTPDFYAPVSAGTAGQVPISAGSGAPTWTTPANVDLLWDTDALSTGQKNFVRSMADYNSLYFVMGRASAEKMCCHIPKSVFKGLNGTNNMLGLFSDVLYVNVYYISDTSIQVHTVKSEAKVLRIYGQKV